MRDAVPTPTSRYASNSTIQLAPSAAPEQASSAMAAMFRSGDFAAARCPPSRLFARRATSDAPSSSAPSSDAPKNVRATTMFREGSAIIAATMPFDPNSSSEDKYAA